jgi:hypothetical protein
MSDNYKPVYGWAMNFGKGYKTIPNNIRNSSCKTENDNPCHLKNSDNTNYCCNPFYKLGPHTQQLICPYYNYTLPDTYPYVPSPIINPRNYWNLPFNVGDWENYYENNIITYKKVE